MNVCINLILHLGVLGAFFQPGKVLELRSFVKLVGAEMSVLSTPSVRSFYCEGIIYLEEKLEVNFVSEVYY